MPQIALLDPSDVTATRRRSEDAREPELEPREAQERPDPDLEGDGRPQGAEAHARGARHRRGDGRARDGRRWFTRNPAGQIFLDPDISEGAEEWLASGYSGEGRELDDDEREQWAPLGAKKLYEATKDKPIAGLQNWDVF